MQRVKWVAGLIVAFAFISSAPLLAAGCSGKTDEPLVNLLQPPPCESCPETRAELEELLELERARTPVQTAAAREDAKRSIPLFLEGAGVSFDSALLTQCEPFFAAWGVQEKEAADAAKNAFCRLRPFKTAGNTLHPVADLKPDDSFSYPSGHAAWAGTIGSLLIQMLPEKKSAIYARINGYAKSRMIAGVHFRSDVEAGKLLGTALASALSADPGLSTELAAAKTCVRKAVGLQ
jgi:acid phosphatase (class A)